MAPISKKKHILSTFMCESSSNYHQYSDSENSNSGSTYENHRNGSSHLMRHLGGSSIHSEEETRQYARVNRVILDKNSDEYRKRRERNNLAVKKSRTKSKMKTIETIEKVSLLRSEKDHLQRKVDLLSRELRLLKDIFMAHASNAHGTTITEYDLKLLTGADLLDLPSMVPSPPSGSLSDYDARSRTSSSASSCSQSLGGRGGSSHLQEALICSPSTSPVSYNTHSFNPRSVVNFHGTLPAPSVVSSRSSICHDSEEDF